MHVSPGAKLAAMAVSQLEEAIGHHLTVEFCSKICVLVYFHSIFLLYIESISWLKTSQATILNS